MLYVSTVLPSVAVTTTGTVISSCSSFKSTHASESFITVSLSPIFTLAYGYSVVTFIFALFANFLIFFLYMSGLSWSGRIFTSFTTTCVTWTFDDFLINSN